MNRRNESMDELMRMNDALEMIKMMIEQDISKEIIYEQIDSEIELNNLFYQNLDIMDEVTNIKKRIYNWIKSFEKGSSYNKLFYGAYQTIKRLDDTAPDYLSKARMEERLAHTHYNNILKRQDEIKLKFNTGYETITDEIISNKLKSHQLYMAGEPDGVRAVFKDVDLSHKSFKEAELQNAVFIHCDCKKTDFEHAKLNNVIFYACDFGKASMMDADLSYADVSLCTFYKTKMSGTALNDVIFSKTYLNPSEINNLKLSNTKFISCYLNDEFKKIDNPNVESHDFIRQLDNDEVSDMLIQHMLWKNDPSRGRRAIFKNCVIKLYDFSNKNLDGVIFENVKFDTCHFKGCSIRCICMMGVVLYNCNLSETDISQSVMVKVGMKDCDLDKAIITELDFIECQLYPRGVKDLYLEKVSFKKTKYNQELKDLFLAKSKIEKKE